jgi:glycosidase
MRAANRGIDVLRLDAVPFLWKRKGTDGQNQPEVHFLIQAFRAPDPAGRAGIAAQGRGDRALAAEPGARRR